MELIIVVVIIGVIGRFRDPQLSKKPLIKPMKEMLLLSFKQCGREKNL